MRTSGVSPTDLLQHTNCEKSQKLSELDSQQSKNDQLNIIQSNLTEIKNQLRNELLTEIKVTIKSEVENLKLSLNEQNKPSELVRRISDIQEKQNQRRISKTVVCVTSPQSCSKWISLEVSSI